MKYPLRKSWKIYLVLSYSGSLILGRWDFGSSASWHSSRLDEWSLCRCVIVIYIPAIFIADSWRRHHFVQSNRQLLRFHFLWCWSRFCCSLRLDVNAGRSGVWSPCWAGIVEVFYSGEQNYPAHPLPSPDEVRCPIQPCLSYWHAAMIQRRILYSSFCSLCSPKVLPPLKNSDVDAFLRTR